MVRGGQRIQVALPSDLPEVPIRGREQFALGIYADYLTEEFNFEDLSENAKTSLAASLRSGNAAFS